MQVRWLDKPGWCDRRLLARIHRYTVDRLRQEIAPVSAATFLRFLARWQHVEPDSRLEGPAGLGEVLRQLAGLDVPAAAWEAKILRARIRDYRREDLDNLTLSGEFVWGRLWGSGGCAVRTAPICLVPREDLGRWLGLAPRLELDLSSEPAALLELLGRRGAMFPLELRQVACMLPSRFEEALGELVARGVVTCDSYGALRQMLVAPSKRRHPIAASGRWSLLCSTPAVEPEIDFVADRLLARYGVLFRKLMHRERLHVPWRDLLRVLRQRELGGQLRGGRFVTGFDGEQFALPEAVAMLRKLRKTVDSGPIEVAAADPLNLSGIVTTDDRVSPLALRNVAVG